MFSFFLKSYRSGLLIFCGCDLNLDYRFKQGTGSFSGKEAFKRFDNGEFKSNDIFEVITRHPNITRAVITAKKSWGLHVNLWSDGVVEGTFRKQEIVEDFESRGIKIPEPFYKDLENRIWSKIAP
jgi:methionine synthase II (cobalamin-independent)